MQKTVIFLSSAAEITNYQTENKTNDAYYQYYVDESYIDCILSNQQKMLELAKSIKSDAGRGFAVVASEIQKLAEQTNSSASIINQIIVTLSDESEQTVSSINEVTELIEDQQQKITLTKEKFSSVTDGIQATTTEIKTVLEQAAKCDGAGQTAADLMTNLSAIAEENAAATEQTTNSVNELHEATTTLSNKAEELMRLSNQLNENLGYFKI